MWFTCNGTCVNGVVSLYVVLPIVIGAFGKSSIVSATAYQPSSLKFVLSALNVKVHVSC